MSKFQIFSPAFVSTGVFIPSHKLEALQCVKINAKKTILCHHEGNGCHQHLANSLKTILHANDTLIFCNCIAEGSVKTTFHSNIFCACEYALKDTDDVLPARDGPRCPCWL